MGPMIQCRKCRSVIRSMHRHDLVWCSCKSVAIDGGNDYTRILGESADVITNYNDFLECF